MEFNRERAELALAVCADWTDDELRAALEPEAPQSIPEDTPLHIKELHFKNGQFDAKFTGPATTAFAEAMVNAFIESGGPNFVSMRAHHPDTGWLEVVIRREHGKTGYDVAAERADRIMELEQEKALMEERLKTLERLVETHGL